MLLDAFLQVSNKQAVTNSAPSTDVIDFRQANPNLGMAECATFFVNVDEAAAAAGAATVTFTVQDSADNATWSDVVSTAAISKDALKVGTKLYIRVPVALRRYCRMNYTVATGPLTAGKFTSGIVTGIDANVAYPDSPRIA